MQQMVGVVNLISLLVLGNHTLVDLWSLHQGTVLLLLRAV